MYFSPSTPRRRATFQQSFYFSDRIRMPRALLSVSDKTGLTEFALGLADLGWELLSTGGSAAALREAGLAVTDVSAVTNHPEMMDGRVKTLHPAVHAGLLARRDNPSDMNVLAAHGYAEIDLVCVNHYPFHEAVAANADVPAAMEKVDIGGPSMLRSAAKNHASVLVVVDPADYPRVLAALRENTAHADFRRMLAGKVFAHTGRYDTAIADYFASRAVAPGTSDSREMLPENITVSLRRVQTLRYGENPDQAAAFYAEPDAPAGSIPRMKQLHGKELSFNNLLDIDSAVMAVSAWNDAKRCACVIIKHTTPCGLALGATPEDAYRRALACDPVSAFGGIVAFNDTVTNTVAAELSKLFLEIVIAPSFSRDARLILQQKKNVRLIELPVAPASAGELDYKRVRGGMLVQQRMSFVFDESSWRVATERVPTEREWRDLRFAWRASASVKSNAIVFVKNEATVGIGAGQMSRVDSSRIAVLKAGDQNVALDGAVLASDAFFPFRDGVDAAAAAGASAIIQPGGSMRDDEVIAAANEKDIAMVFTNRRIFRH
jgi:phosphoribosylaminoimidazolecarboxamide formyltransferase/IMP cyclohydrolase